MVSSRAWYVGASILGLNVTKITPQHSLLFLWRSSFFCVSGRKVISFSVHFCCVNARFFLWLSSLFPFPSDTKPVGPKSEWSQPCVLQSAPILFSLFSLSLLSLTHCLFSSRWRTRLEKKERSVWFFRPIRYVPQPNGLFPSISGSISWRTKRVRQSYRARSKRREGEPKWIGCYVGSEWAFFLSLSLPPSQVLFCPITRMTIPDRTKGNMWTWSMRWCFFQLLLAIRTVGKCKTLKLHMDISFQ